MYLHIIEYLYQCYSIQLLRHEENVSIITNDVKVNHIKARKQKQTKKTMEIFIFNITIYVMTVLMRV